MVEGPAVAVDDSDFVDRLSCLRNAVGGIQGPFEAFLALKGLKTLQNVVWLTRSTSHLPLEGHPRIGHDHHPGLATTWPRLG